MASDLTVVLLNWRRPDNLLAVVDSLASQTLRPRIYLWNNAPEDVCHHAIDWQVRSSENRGCWPRWFMASQADTRWVMSLDDDLLLSDRGCLARLVRHCDASRGPDRVFGLEGVRLVNGRWYSGSLHARLHPPDADGRPADVIKGRLMCFRRGNLDTCVRMHWSVSEDDIAISGLLAAGRVNFHRVLPWLRDCVKELPAPHALCERPDHMGRRDAAARAFFHWHGGD